MSSPSTPRSTRSASPTGNSPNVLTPGQKIKAMMAQFDSDSETENQNNKSSRPISKPDFGSKTTEPREAVQSSDSAEDSDDAEDIIRPRGRMAARMQANANQPNTSESTEESAFARLSKALRTEREQAQQSQQKSPALEAESNDEDLPAAVPRRKNYNASQSPAPQDQSPNRSRSASPLFVSPAPARHDDVDQDGDSDDNGELPLRNDRFQALVAKKRKEREEREKLEAEQKAARRSQMEQFSSEVLSGEESGADDEGASRKLSQKARQPRKASKKAMDEMHRETQRMSRNMQLAHQAQTKKKISKESFFARFNFMQPDAPRRNQQQRTPQAPRKTRDTPNTSPVIAASDVEKPITVETGSESQPEPGEKSGDIPDLPTLQGAIASAKDGSKSPNASAIAPAVVAAAQADASIEKTKKEPLQMTRPPVRVLMSRQEVARHQKDDSDTEDDLEVVTSPAKCRRIAAFENLPAKKMQESASMTKLKALAHLTSPTRKASSMNSAELSASLLYKARQQAARDRRERIEELRAKGVVIETAEDRAAMEDDVEDLVEKARKEADDIAREERAAKKKAQGLDDDDEDEDYQISGSDDDGSANEEDEEEEEDDDKSVSNRPGFVDQEADEADDSDNESEAPESEAEVEAPGTRRKRPTRVVSDDEEEEAQIPSTPVRPPSNAVRSAERPQLPDMETPGMSMGLTQAFAGTLADEAGSQTGSATIPFSLPDPGRPVPRLRAEESEILVRDSQEEAPDFMANYSQNVTRVSESPAGHRFSQFSQLPDPTQDEGFVFSPFDPSKRFRDTPPVSTVDTILVDQSQSPVAERKARHLRRGRARELSAVPEGSNEGDFEIDANAFNVMKKASKKKKDAVAYDKKNSEAKGIVDEAAEESEDEYAGLGGGSDDSEGEEDVLDEQMINDNSGEKVDEKQLAALNASHQRDRDEKDVAKLMKDITTGALRRRRGADDEFDLDDSDDERVARQREKQREFAKMRRALLADDKVGALAENPKKAAFFKAIEDREEEEDFELDFLEENGNDSQNESSQDVAPEAQAEGPGDSAQDSKKRKRPLEATAEETTNRPPPHLRRTAASAMSKKPASLAEIRETLSFLTETPEYDSFHEDASLDEDHNEDESNTPDPEAEEARPEFAVPSHPRRTRGPVVDRLALLRQASSNSASGTSGSGNTKLAFQAGGADGPIGFRPPQLLRRVNSGSSSGSSSTTSTRVTKPAASGPKKGGAVNSYTAAREKEREKQLRMKQRNGGSNMAKLLSKHSGGGLGGLAGKGQWD
ncbi:hypothetical protein N7512_007088 [Penicillium capsulatum]|nr:hypothetical protein N7512_007088 [Penicillium capsulatum]